MDGYVSKPIRADELHSAIDAVRDLKRAGRNDRRAKLPLQSHDSATSEAAGFEIPWFDIIEEIGADEATVMSIATEYVLEIEEVGNRLPQLIEELKFSGIEQAAHKLKSALRFFRQESQASFAQGLEDAGRESNAEDVRTYFGLLQPAISPANYGLSIEREKPQKCVTP